METTKYREVWELDSLFPGGSESSQLLKHIKELEGKVYTFANHVSYFLPMLPLICTYGVKDSPGGKKRLLH